MVQDGRNRVLLFTVDAGESPELRASLLKRESSQFEHHTIQQGSGLYNYLLEEREVELNQYGVQTERSKLRDSKLCEPVLLHTPNEDDLIIAYPEVTASYDCQVCLYDIRANREIAKVIGAQSLLCKMPSAFARGNSEDSFLFFADPYANHAVKNVTESATELFTLH